ncbi:MULTISPECIES: chromosomal replication initiator protein DnaA [Calditerrivibrio]|uniref:Chromosomal replication initiator protein DnaA n=1 Tax=Calditerrivibrio nitroreducens TaxID=477976 RepID=A0A2J6WMB5_9BACT|nr:MAG: chromosomal replication initiator protein DnaA [Calditerrivibrio nitroreducens]
MDNNLWEEVLKLAEARFSPQIVNTWLKPLKILDMRGDLIIIEAPNRFYKNWVEDKYLETLKKIFLEEYNIQSEIQIVIGSSTQSYREQAQDQTVKTQNTILNNSTNLNKQYTFDNFVVGSSNQFSHAAALAVAEGYFQTYNPLFIYGGVGLGKTHLMHAIGNKILEKFPKLKILYISSEAFTNEMIYALKSKTMDIFREKYRNIDLLLFDDVQFLAGKTRSTEEFFYTFNSLYDMQKQIVLTSDKEPNEIPDLEERLRSRFSWGLVADIQPPSVDEKVAIILKRSEIMNIYISDEVAHFLAENLKGDNIRDLIGALIRLNAFSTFHNEPITIDLAKKALEKFMIKKDIIVTPESVINAVCSYFNVKLQEIKSKNRSRVISYPRQVAMYILREKLNLPLQDIANIFGGRNHSTVLHSIKEIQNRIQSDQELKSVINTIIRNIYK